MSLLKRLLGRAEPPPKPDLDALFALPGAVLTLEAAMGVRATGTAAVAFREAEGGAARSTVADVVALLDADEGPPVRREVDSFGYTWLVVTAEPSAGGAVDVPGLVTDLHAVNATLVDAGFGPTLLCSVLGLAVPERTGPLALVYLYKRGTFYPFAPREQQARDSALELQVRAALGADLPIEQDLSRWFPVWGAPGL